MCDAYEPPKAGEEGARVLGGVESFEREEEEGEREHEKRKKKNSPSLSLSAPPPNRTKPNPNKNTGELKPIPTNARAPCAAAMDKCAAEEPWFGIEQEYTLLNTHTKWPLGWPTSGYPGPQGETGEGERVARAARSFFLPSTRPPPPHAVSSRLSRPLLLLRGRGRGDRARHH